MAPAAGRPDPAGRNLPAPYVSPWRLLRQDLRAVLASLRLKLHELWRRNAAGELPRPSFWPRRLAAWFLPLLLGVLLALALAVIGLGLAFSTSRPEPSSQAPPSAVVPPMPEFSLPASTNPRTAKPRGTSPPAIRFPESSSSGTSDARALRPGSPDPGAPDPGTNDRGINDGGRPAAPARGLVEARQPGGQRPGGQRPGDQRQRQVDMDGVELAADPWVDALKVPAGGPEPMAMASGSPDRLAAWPAQQPVLDPEASLGAASGDGLDAPPGPGNTAAIAPTVSSEPLEATGWLANPAETVLAQLREATPQAPPQAIQLADSPITVVLRTAAGFEQASAAARQDWADRWLELVREQGYSKLTLLDPAGRLLGNQARVGSGMILLQPFREPP